jgi:anti-sigma regulatory factor (Ser/Thr protein kinase)
MLSPLCPYSPDATSGRAVTLLDVRLPAEARQLSGARHQVEQAARTFGLGERECFEFVFAVNEAVTNAVRHGAEGAHDTFGLSVEAQAGALTATVTSRVSFVPAPGCADLWAEGGRGFHYMRLLVDDVRVRSTPTGTAVHLRKTAHAVGEAA